MFNLFKKPTSANTAAVTFKLGSMHCTSCAVDIDISLEEIEGVISANTNYQTSIIVVNYSPNTITPQTIQDTIRELGYEALDCPR